MSEVKIPLRKRVKLTKAEVTQRMTDKRQQTVILPGFEDIPLNYKARYGYKNNYAKLARLIRENPEKRNAYYKKLILTDLFFVVYFILRMKKANHPFVINRCREVEEGPERDIIDLWARGHFKSTILTTAKPIQKILRDPEERICIFSFKKENALKFYLPIKEIFEKRTILHELFPHILNKNPSDYTFWTRDLGFSVKRKGTYREPTLMWSALNEGTPVGMHFTGKIYDDIMTAEMARSFAEIQKVKDAFDMSQNLTDNDTGEDDTRWEIIAGTRYHYLDVFDYLIKLKNIDGTLAYKVRFYPATHNGKADGVPVLVTQEELDRLKRNRQAFASQQLLNPVPEGDRKLNSGWLVEVTPSQLPPNLFKFLMVDPAGDEETMKTRGKGDKWAIALIGVEPARDDLGQPNNYLLDFFLRRATMTEAMSAICRMYLLAGRVAKLGVEKVGTSTYEIHIANALKKYGAFLTVVNGRLVLLRPGMRNKQDRILSALEWPLSNGKWHYVNTCPEKDIKDLKTELDAFPLGMDDGMDIISYVPDITKDYKFPLKEAAASIGFTKPNDMWRDEDISPRSPNIRGWLVG